MGVSKVVYGNDTLIDLTGDTVTESALASGYTAHNKAGDMIVGSLIIPTVPTDEIAANTSARHTHDNKSVLDGITGQVTVEKVHNPDNATDLVQYAAFQTITQEIIAKIPTVPTKISAFDNDSGYLTDHQSLIDYAKKTEIPTAIKNPNTLTIKNGSTIVSYDGSEAKTVEFTDGRTPVKGVDYWTAADKQMIVNDVLDALPTWSGGSY